jgi:hypothetical protein
MNNGQKMRLENATGALGGLESALLELDNFLTRARWDLSRAPAERVVDAELLESTELHLFHLESRVRLLKETYRELMSEFRKAQ